jgi:sortase A
MDSKNGGRSSSDLQRQTAAAIARKRVLAAYAKSANEARKEASKNKAHLKNELSRLNSESWKKYHSAWQNYYQKYYNDYYSRAAQNYIARERLKDERERAEEEEILTKIAKSSIKTNKTNGLTLGTDNDITSQDSTIKDNLRQKIRKKATENAKFSHRHRHLIPIIAGIVVVLIILFLQYNRLIFAPIMAYVSPGNSPASEIEAIDPTITQTISPEPRLIIPKLNIDVPVHFGVQLSDVMASMNNGVAHYRIAGASAYPGEIGNLVITGHSAGDIYSSNPYKYIFSGLERLNDGDLIYINYNSVRYTYRVTKKEVVEPTNVAALVVNTDKPILTLVTCTPLGTSRYRLLVTAEQISPNPDTAESSKNPVTVDQNLDQEMPSNEPSFFEGIWNWLTGN